MLLLASGDPNLGQLGPLGGKAHHPARARRWLDSYPLADCAARLRGRAQRERFDAHPSELPRLMGREDVMRTGIAAAEAVGLHGGRGDIELYAPAGRRADIVAEHALEPGEGPVLLRWVPDELWPLVRREADRALRG